MAAPPGNANAPLAKGRREKLTGGGGYAVCPHSAIFSELAPAGHLHHAAERCADCGAYIRRLPKPETVERRRLNVLRLKDLTRCARLSSWERAFVRSVSQLGRVSPRQQRVVDSLCATYLGRQTS
jgi:hypothetical protein